MEQNLEFDSVEAYKDFASPFLKHFTNWDTKEKPGPTLGGSNQKWYGSTNLAQIFERVNNGWAEGADTIHELSESLSLEVPKPRSIRRRNIRSDAGDWLDIHRVYAGELSTAWTRPVRRAVNGSRVITLVASMQGNVSAKQHIFFWRAAAALCLADMLTEAGYNVRVVSEYKVDSQGSGILQHRVTVKDALSPLDLNGLAATVGLAGFKRSWGFMAVKQHIELLGGKNNYGSWISLVEDQSTNAPDTFGGTSNVISQNESELACKGKAIQWVTATLARIEGGEGAP